jgi:KinB signaling pathway activation protein
MIITNIVIGWENITGGLDATDELLAAGIWLFIVGLMFSVISQMGFFAYLMIHRIGLGVFKGPRLWNWVQIVLILFVFFDLVYFRYIVFAEPGMTWTDYLPLPSVLLVIAIIVAWLKARMTNFTAFIPTVFFIYVVTTVEIVPALTQNDAAWVTLMFVTVLVCNVWQVLILHRLLEPANKKSA